MIQFTVLASRTLGIYSTKTELNVNLFYIVKTLLVEMGKDKVKDTECKQEHAVR